MRGDDQDARIHDAGAYRARREAVTLGLAAFGLLLLLTRGPTVADAGLHLDTAEGIWRRGSTALTFDPGVLVVTTEPLAGGLVYMDEAGVVRSSQSPGFALLALPFVGAGSEIARRTGAGPLAAVLDPLFVDDGASYRALIGPLVRDPRAISMSLIGPLSGGATLVFVWLALAALGVPRTRRAWITAALFVSPLGVFAGTCWTQSFTAAAVSFATWRVVRASGGAPVSGWGAGLALALSVAVRPDHALIVPAFALALGASPRRVVAVVLPTAAALLGLWLHGLPVSAGGWSLETLPVGIPGLLLSPLTGLLVYAPFVALAPLGMRRCPRAMRWLGAVPILQLLLYGGWFDWDATLALGPRFLVPSLPVLAVFAGLTGGRTLPWLVALGAAVNLPAHLLAHARVPESHAFFRPVFLDAWETLLWHGDEAVGAGIDCASTQVAFYGWAALLTALVGAAMTLTPPRGQPAGRAERALRR